MIPPYKALFRTDVSIAWTELDLDFQDDEPPDIVKKRSSSYNLLLELNMASGFLAGKDFNTLLKAYVSEIVIGYEFDIQNY